MADPREMHLRSSAQVIPKKLATKKALPGDVALFIFGLVKTSLLLVEKSTSLSSLQCLVSTNSVDDTNCSTRNF